MMEAVIWGLIPAFIGATGFLAYRHFDRFQKIWGRLMVASYLLAAVFAFAFLGMHATFNELVPFMDVARLDRAKAALDAIAFWPKLFAGLCVAYGFYVVALFAVLEFVLLPDQNKQ